MYTPSLHSRSTCQLRHTLAPLATAILISLLGVLPPSSLVWAQGSAQNSGRAIDIPAGPLGPALARYAQHMQVLLSFPPPKPMAFRPLAYKESIALTRVLHSS